MFIFASNPEKVVSEPPDEVREVELYPIKPKDPRIKIRGFKEYAKPKIRREPKLNVVPSDDIVFKPKTCFFHFLTWSKCLLQ